MALKGKVQRLRPAERNDGVHAEGDGEERAREVVPVRSRGRLRHRRHERRRVQPLGGVHVQAEEAEAVRAFGNLGQHPLEGLARVGAVIGGDDAPLSAELLLQEDLATCWWKALPLLKYSPPGGRWA